MQFIFPSLPPSSSVRPLAPSSILMPTSIFPYTQIYFLFLPYVDDDRHNHRQSHRQSHHHSHNHNHKYRISSFKRYFIRQKNKKGDGNGIKEIQHKTAARSLKVVHHQLTHNPLFSRLFLYFLALAFLSFVLNSSKCSNLQRLMLNAQQRQQYYEKSQKHHFLRPHSSRLSRACCSISSGHPFSPVKEEALKQYGSININLPS